MPLTPQRLVADLFARPTGCAAAQAAPSPAARASGAAAAPDRDAPWTPADVPLLDEAAELLGEDDARRRGGAGARRGGGARSARLEYARRRARDVRRRPRCSTAEALVERYAGDGPAAARVAERAARATARWTFGHVVVDEAQELSPMAVAAARAPLPDAVDDRRRRPGADQLARPARPRGPQCSTRTPPGRWRLAELTVNYRTPARSWSSPPPCWRRTGSP